MNYNTVRLSISKISTLAILIGGLVLSMFAMYYYSGTLKKHVPIITHTSNHKNHHAVHTQLVQGLAQEEKQIWQELEQIGITKDAFNELYKRDLPKVSGKTPIPPSISKANRQLIEKILQEQGIDPQTISIKKTTLHTPAAALSHTLLINNQLFTQLPDGQKRGVLRHEIQHIKHFDSYTLAVIAALLDTTVSMATQKHNHPLAKLARFQEKRADLLSALSSKQAAVDFVSFMSDTVKSHQYPDNTTHPPQKERLALGEKVLNHFGTNNTQTIVVA